MAKAFAKNFYKSKAWINTRNAYVAERVCIDGGVCERCGLKTGNAGEELHHKIPLSPRNITDGDITLNPKNLQWLCKDCHFIVHRELIMEQFRKARAASKRRVHNGCYFNEEGELVQMKVYVVHGSPASGKTSYVREHMSPGDLVVDLDYIKSAISFMNAIETPDNLLPVAIGIRDYLYDLIEERAVDCCNIWVIGCLPERAERRELIERLDAEEVHCSADYHECIARASIDDEHRSVTLRRALIDKYFERFEP